VAAPLWAGFTALVNQQNADEGKAALGFANPAIYDLAESPRYASDFHDITVGNNTNAVSPYLYYAQPGYDLCTGWGTPTGQSLIDSLTGFSGPVFVDFNYTGGTQNGNYTTPFKTLAGGVGAVSTFGTIFIKTAGSSPETMTISKPMTITAIDGASTVGH
jgi:subtilase family serine protease